MVELQAIRIRKKRQLCATVTRRATVPPSAVAVNEFRPFSFFPFSYWAVVLFPPSHVLFCPPKTTAHALPYQRLRLVVTLVQEKLNKLDEKGKGGLRLAVVYRVYSF